MQSNYKRLGKYIQVVNKRNTDLKVEKLLGVSIRKVLMPSIANTVGTNMKTYKIIKKNQFAYGPVTSRNGDKISVALLEEFDEAIVSQAYTVFEVLDETELMPEYLMMWFRRPEFDRYARFMSHGSARETFDWDEMCDIKLPIPNLQKQQEIVNEYNTIVNRIKLNEQLNQKLEETAQAIYKHWFVDFEFPNEDKKPYKSNGGKMVFNEELEKEIPVEWEQVTLGYLLSEKGYIRGPFGSALKKDDMIPFGIPVYEQKHAIDNHRNFRYFISKEKHKSLKRFTIAPNDMVISCSGTLGRVAMIKENDQIGVINQALLILRINTNIFKPTCFYYYLTSTEGNNLLIENSSGSAQVNIAKREVIQSIPFVLPPNSVQKKMEKNLLVLLKRTNLIQEEIISLLKLKTLLLSKMSKVELDKTLI